MLTPIFIVSPAFCEGPFLLLPVLPSSALSPVQPASSPTASAEAANTLTNFFYLQMKSPFFIDISDNSNQSNPSGVLVNDSLHLEISLYS